VTTPALPLTPTEVRVAKAMANNGYRVALAAIGRDTAICHDAGINGIDV
jgi:hypothetical protein